MWNEINNEKGLRDFMDMFNNFHDSCIKELKYLSGAYVSEDLSMHPINDKRVLKVIIQRQFISVPVIEMEFSGLKSIRMYPNNEDYTCEILDTTMFLKDGFVYWCDYGGLTETDLEMYKGTIICASKLRWRKMDEYIGQKEVY